MSKNEEVEEKISKGGATAGAKSNNVFISSLLIDCLKGNLENVKLHLDRGAEIEDRHGSDETALRLASQNGHDKMVQLTLDRGLVEINSMLTRFSYQL